MPYKDVKMKRKAQQRYAKSDKGKEAEVKYREKKLITQAEWRVNNADKRKAHQLSRHLPAKACSVYGCGDMGQKHHPDYTQPLLVEYLCASHHGEVHNEI